MRIADLILIDLFEDISKDELIKRLQKKRESQFLDMILEKMHELVKVMGDRQSIGGSAFDVSRMLGGAISGKELERLYKEKYTNESQVNEWGRVVKGVNTTADVGPAEIKKQAAKFGNTVDKDGRPPTLSKKVKGSKTNVLHNLGLSEMEKACIEGGHSLEDLKPLKEKKKTPSKIFETLIGLTEDIAPHGSPEQEAQLMIAGKKPAALTQEQDFFKHFQTPAEMYDWVVLKFDLPNSVYTKYVVAQPGEANRAKQIASLVTAANKINFKFQNKNREIEYHKTLGNLLGYKDSDIEDFIKSTVIKEAFDTDVEWIKGAAPQGASVFAAKVDDAYIELTYKRMTNDDVYIAFSRRGRSNVTGEGKQNKIFGAVINHIKQWVNKNKPSKIIFSAWKPITGAFGAQDTTRSNLYRKMVQRFASQNGYDYDIEDTGNEDTFILTKKNIEETLLSEALKDYTTFAQSKFQEPNPKNKVDGVILGSKHYGDRETEKLVISEKQEVVRMFKKFVKDPVNRKVTNVDAEEGVSFCLFNDNNLGVALKKREFKFDQTDDLFVGYLVTTVSQNLLPYSDQLLFRVPNDPNEPCRLFNEQDKETLSRSQTKALGKQGRFGK